MTVCSLGRKNQTQSHSACICKYRVIMQPGCPHVLGGEGMHSVAWNKGITVTINPGNGWPRRKTRKQLLMSPGSNPGVPKMCVSTESQPHRTCCIGSSPAGLRNRQNESIRWSITKKVVSFAEGMTGRGLWGFLETGWHSVQRLSVHRWQTQNPLLVPD